MKFHIKFSFCSLIFILICFSCVEPIDVSDQISSDSGLEGTLVVEATITSSEIKQVVLLSRMRKIEDDSSVNSQNQPLFSANSPIRINNGLGPVAEENARVEILDSNGNNFLFEETTPGRYESEDQFAAMPGTGYTLNIITSEGSEYASNQVQTPVASTIDSVYAERTFNDRGVEGIAIYTDSSLPSSASSLIRYAYEETYKIIAPNWTPLEFQIISEGDPGAGIPPQVTTVPRQREERVCFRTEPSTGIQLTDVGSLENNRLRRYEIRFLSMSNPAISHRYSILVKQYTLTDESYAFYESLDNFSSSENVFSQVQPGFLEGNVFSVSGGERVIGLLDVTSEVSQRLFFNYTDFFPDAPLPPYFGNTNCDRLLSPPIGDPALDGPTEQNCPQPLTERIKLGLVEYVDQNPDPSTCEGPYFVTPTICGDCNILGSNVVPDFWEE
ncbi:DUF4249 domain-containing protein [Robertkochia aurantiaca]|uniref:DUF4249 domain-containing protein n=1 Tax=Robertkochia aurantiaca TaxID=2873700 RepID=UPI001CCE7693|nr:DUF4249 domain-containing protein [Robertkochia sp. 3YJGBD-33]